MREWTFAERAHTLGYMGECDQEEGVMECLVRRTRTARPPFPATTVACSALSLLSHRSGRRTRRTPGWSNWSIYSPRTSPDSAHQIGRPLTPHAGSPVALHAPIHWTMQRYVKNRGWWNVRLHNPPLPQPLCVLRRRSLAVSISLCPLTPDRSQTGLVEMEDPLSPDEPSPPSTPSTHPSY